MRRSLQHALGAPALHLRCGIRQGIKAALSRGDYGLPEAANDVQTYSSSAIAGTRLEGKVAVITGGASGIGEATAKAFVAQGAKVVVTDIQDRAGKDLVAQLGENACYVHCDVTIEDDIAAAVQYAVENFGGIDVFHNNAGIFGTSGPVDEVPLEQWNKTVSTILTSVFLGTKHAARVMKPAKKGSIINTSSVAGLSGGYGAHCYTACKHGIVGFTKSLASELRYFNVRANCLAPGYIRTPLMFHLEKKNVLQNETVEAIKHSHPQGVSSFFTSAEEVANAALFLASDDSTYVSGHTLVVDGSHTVSPSFFPGLNRYHQVQTMSYGSNKEEDDIVPHVQ